MKTLIVKGSNQALVAIVLNNTNLKQLEELRNKAMQGKSVSHNFPCYATSKETHLENRTNARSESISVLSTIHQTITLEATAKGIISAGGTTITWSDIFESTSKTMGFFVIEPLSDLTDGTTGEFTYMTVDIDPRDLNETQQWQAARQKINAVLKEQGREDEVPIANRYV